MSIGFGRNWNVIVSVDVFNSFERNMTTNVRVTNVFFYPSPVLLKILREIQFTVISSRFCWFFNFSFSRILCFFTFLLCSLIFFISVHVIFGSGNGSRYGDKYLTVCFDFGSSMYLTETRNRYMDTHHTNLKL